MDVGKTAALLVVLGLATPAWAGEPIENPIERSTMVVAIGVSVVVASPFITTTGAPALFKSAKDDATAFVGSDGAIRGVAFERAVQEYRAGSGPRPMSDMQLALAIVTL